MKMYKYYPYYYHEVMCDVVQNIAYYRKCNVINANVLFMFNVHFVNTKDTLSASANKVLFGKHH